MEATGAQGCSLVRPQKYAVQGPVGGSLGGACTARTGTHTELTILFLSSLLLFVNV